MQLALLCFGITAMNIVRDLKKKGKQKRKRTEGESETLQSLLMLGAEECV